MKSFFNTTVKCLALLLFIGTTSAAFASGNTESEANGKLKVIATTGHIGDALNIIAPNADVFILVGPGLDPHTYEASTKDIAKFRNADFVFWNALHLEAQMADMIHSLGDKQLGLGDQLPESLLLPWEGNTYDPHIWNSTKIWSIVVGYIGDKLAEIDPVNASDYLKRTKDYQKQIAKNHKYAKKKLAMIPEDRRVLVSGHDAFNYLANAYGFESKAIMGISTEDEASINDLRNLADYIIDKKVKTIFYETIVNPQASQALKEAVESRGGKVKISDDTLFSDALGEEAPLDSYLGTFKYNIDTIVNNLKE